MGEAKKRGTFEQRKQEAIDSAPKPLSEKDRADITAHLEKLAEQEVASTKMMAASHIKHTQFYERILNSAATQGELEGKK